MPPKRLGNDFKTIRVKCAEGHEVARYRKPRSEWGNKTHKLWLVPDRIARLVTVPPILVGDGGDQHLDVPETGTSLRCGTEECARQIGEIALVQGTPAIVLNKPDLMPTKG